MEDARDNPLRPFLLRIVRKGKRKHKDKAGKTRQEDKPRSNKGKAPKAGQKDKTKGKKDKKEGKHATSPKTAKHLTHTKATQATQSTQPIQTHIQQGKPSKNALKTRNKAIFASNAPRTKR